MNCGFLQEIPSLPIIPKTLGGSQQRSGKFRFPRAKAARGAWSCPPMPCRKARGSERNPATSQVAGSSAYGTVPWWFEVLEHCFSLGPLKSCPKIGPSGLPLFSGGSRGIAPPQTHFPRSRDPPSGSKRTQPKKPPILGPQQRPVQTRFTQLPIEWRAHRCNMSENRDVGPVGTNTCFRKCNGVDCFPEFSTLQIWLL